MNIEGNKIIQKYKKPSSVNVLKPNNEKKSLNFKQMDLSSKLDTIGIKRPNPKTSIIEAKIEVKTKIEKKTFFLNPRRLNNLYI